MVVDFVGSAESGEWALDRIAPNGRLVLVNTFFDRTLRVDPRRLVERQARVMGSRYASRHEIAVAAAHVAAGRFDR